MSYPPTTREEAFRQEISIIQDTDDIDFARKHYLLVNKHRCKKESKPQACIEEGRSIYDKFVHEMKRSRQQAFYCFSACKEEGCYETCKQNLAEKVSQLYSPMAPVINDYLLQYSNK
ncbi:unnamed protein product [Blepharisma stoltei]|uniref:Uncharacterized protein n=1 Tax=Blepharisma stoltei TaxID=1481888 RepID=A0AAU9ISQ6_9CILI|nr:unnamed protein product [Blepharisma stoltei]